MSTCIRKWRWGCESEARPRNPRTRESRRGERKPKEMAPLMSSQGLVRSRVSEGLWLLERDGEGQSHRKAAKRDYDLKSTPLPNFVAAECLDLMTPCSKL